MKKHFVVLTLFILLFNTGAAWAGEDPGGGAEPPYFTGPNAAIASLEEQLPLVHVLAYNDHATFWQGKKTPTITPVQGEPVTFDTSRTADRHASWAGAGLVVSSTVDYSLQVDVYQFPYGWGYSITCEFYYDGDLYRTVRTYNQTAIPGGHAWQIVN